VAARFSLKKLRDAAISQAFIVTGKPPYPMTEIYGARAFDMSFDESMVREAYFCRIVD
jgi:hypothetical protein